jgi:hypothetical protein
MKNNVAAECERLPGQHALEEAAPVVVFVEAVVEVQHNHTWASPRRLYFNE